MKFKGLSGRKDNQAVYNSEIVRAFAHGGRQQIDLL